MILQLENIKGGYHKETTILKGINLQLKKGEIMAIIGQNGTGKSTLAKALINILPFREGKIYFNQQNISTLNTLQLNKMGIVYVMQGARVFSELTVKENMAFASLNHPEHKTDFNLFPSLKKHWLDEAGLLSGGEKHQLALAMALAKTPKLLILDEPSAGLSPIATTKLYKTLATIKKNTQLSMLIIEHNLNHIISFSNQIAILKQGTIHTILDTKNEQQTIKTIQNLYF